MLTFQSTTIIYHHIEKNLSKINKKIQKIQKYGKTKLLALVVFPGIWNGRNWPFDPSIFEAISFLVF